MEVTAKAKKARVSRKSEELKLDPNALKFDNKREDLEFLRGNREFFQGLQQLSEKFYREVRAFGDQHRTEINTTVSFKIG